MKKIVLLVAVFLVGTATQMMANQKPFGIENPRTHNHYYNSNTIRFIEANILFEVTTEGTFTFQELGQTHTYNSGRRGHRNRPHCAIATDRFGRILAIGYTEITYNRFGKVRTIGKVPLYYERGSLVQVGKMKIKYHRHGGIKDTKGYINKENKKFWHDDWYSYTERKYKGRHKKWKYQDDDDDRNRRKRK